MATVGKLLIIILSLGFRAVEVIKIVQLGMASATELLLTDECMCVCTLLVLL